VVVNPFTHFVPCSFQGIQAMEALLRYFIKNK
jgi:hypothetical protein